MELDGDLVLIEAMAINIICRKNTALGNYVRINWKMKRKSTNGACLQYGSFMCGFYSAHKGFRCKR